MSRDHMTEEEQAAHALLDAVKAGSYVPYPDIMRALWILGDAVGNPA